MISQAAADGHMQTVWLLLAAASAGVSEVVAGIALLSAVMIYLWVPAIPKEASASPWAELAALVNKQVWLTLGIGAIGFGGMFAVFNYIKPSLMALAGLTEAGVPFVLALFGAVAVQKNIRDVAQFNRAHPEFDGAAAE